MATAGVRDSLFFTDAVLPESHQPFPAELWNIRLGTNYLHKFDNGRLKDATEKSELMQLLSGKTKREEMVHALSMNPQEYWGRLTPRELDEALEPQSPLLTLAVSP